MAFSEKFKSLHAGEEAIRAQSVDVISKSESLSLHIATLEAALNVIDHFALRYVTEDQDKLVVQLLGVRLFNATGTALTVLLAGYYQNAAMQMRDILETWFLLDYFSASGERITRWRTVDSKMRQRDFSPIVVRMALDARDGFEGKKRAEHYKLLSSFGTHPSPESFRLYRHEPNGLAELGPFFNATSLDALLQELAKLMTAAATTFGRMLEVRGRADQLVRLDWLDAMGKWASHFAGLKYEPGEIAEFRARVMTWPDVLPKRK